ncbi:hypothetical protein TWF730_007943 [Orbilia blumenaviensis]|uniref:Uncharacterized protein n=1 Tax=Orbilia blumenaviensis TaxID=1796055 RepID=A0AAV9VAN9_9PEZI
MSIPKRTGVEGETDHCHPQTHPNNQLFPKYKQKKRSPFLAIYSKTFLRRRQDDEISSSLKIQIPSKSRGWLKTLTDFDASQNDPGCGDATEISAGPQETSTIGRDFITPVENGPGNSIPATRGFIPQNSVREGEEGEKITSRTQILQPSTAPPSTTTQRPLNEQPSSPPNDQDPNNTTPPARGPGSISTRLSTSITESIPIPLIPLAPSTTRDVSNPGQPTNEPGLTTQIQENTPQGSPLERTILAPGASEKGSYFTTLSSSIVFRTYTSNDQLYTSPTLLTTLPPSDNSFVTTVTTTQQIITATAYTTTNDSSLKPAVIGGAVAGSLAVILLAFASFYFFLLRRRQKVRDVGLG